jgi:hypothetical protein
MTDRMKDHDILLTQEPPLSPAGVLSRAGQEASNTAPTLMLVPVMPRRIAQKRLKARFRHPR